MRTKGYYCPIVGKWVRQEEYSEKKSINDKGKAPCQASKGVCDGNCAGCVAAGG